MTTPPDITAMKCKRCDHAKHRGPCPWREAYPNGETICLCVAGRPLLERKR